MQCVAQQAGIRTLANYIRCYVVITVIGVSYILKTWHGMFTGKGKQKFLVQLMTVTQLQQSIISFFFCKFCSLHRNFDDSTLCLSHITNCGTHLCESSLSSITDKPLSIRILFIILAITSFTLYTLCVVIMGCYPAAVFYTLHN